ncbi:hypothetical protein M413DRAFT_64018 [Hebeloma cylindrosporum]|uniref:FAD-dependent urate hydroxylase HpyO/Asp monooxygenase CreE-like FAD/NAD(P)-binding domain-containing protein n=1 Tax=Hebeloma cylindrosporum TaxID=76867 RepID=A0A0C2YAG4_HEBCY|nr:hypothetical protein M413DRAFT_64018 [Hebeloma cylindrosporum h7]
MQTIGIIGAGPSGLAALKVVLESAQFKAGKWAVVVFEARETVGGVWYVPLTAVSSPAECL